HRPHPPLRPSGRRRGAAHQRRDPPLAAGDGGDRRRPLPGLRLDRGRRVVPPERRRRLARRYRRRPAAARSGPAAARLRGDFRMKALRSVLAFLFFAALVLPAWGEGPVTIRVGKLLDGKGGAMNDVTVVIEGSKIVAVETKPRENPTWDLR